MTFAVNPILSEAEIFSRLKNSTMLILFAPLRFPTKSLQK